MPVPMSMRLIREGAHRYTMPQHLIRMQSESSVCNDYDNFSNQTSYKVVLNLLTHNFRVVEILLKRDCNICVRDNQGFNAAHYAAINGHKLALEMVSIL